jgi:hypothetical protein
MSSLQAVLGKALSVPRADVFINLVEVARENWSFGQNTQ